MSDIHVLTGDNSIGWTLVFHFPVPDVNNSVGISFRTALVNSKIGVGEDGRRTILTVGTPPTIGPGEIHPDEEVLLDVGELFEHVAIFRVESGGTSNAQVKASIREFYASENAAVQAGIGSILRYFGHTESAA